MIGKRGVWATPDVDEIKVTFDGGGGAIATGPSNSFYTSAGHGWIESWYLTGYPSGDLVIDVWKKNNDIPTVADTITGTEKPSLTAQQLNKDLSLATWTRRVDPGDTFTVNVDSVTGVEKAVLTIRIIRT